MSRIMRLADSFDTHGDAEAIADYGLLLAFALAHPDADTALPQMHRITWLIVEHAQAITAREEAITVR